MSLREVQRVELGDYLDGSILFVDNSGLGKSRQQELVMLLPKLHTPNPKRDNTVCCLFVTTSRNLPLPRSHSLYILLTATVHQQFTTYSFHLSRCHSQSTNSLRHTLCILLSDIDTRLRRWSENTSLRATPRFPPPSIPKSHPTWLVRVIITICSPLMSPSALSHFHML